MKWDHIIVGAGSAGCALANELVRAGRRVLVIEAGGRDRSPFIKIASGQIRAMAKHDWGYWSEPDPSRNGKRENWVRGRVLGGSSSINGTLFVRGTTADYDNWGVSGWTATDVMPILREIENSDQPGPLRGHSGPLHVRTVKRPHVVTEAFVESIRAAGHDFNADYNGERQEGIAYAQLSQHGGFRCSAADAFLKPLLGMKNLTVLLNAETERIEIANGKAVAVRFVHNNRRRREVARDIVLCSGVINSPKLLMLSGIGDPKELERHNIDVVCDLPAVGRNMKEQPLVSLVYRTKIPTNNLTEGLFQKLGIATKFLTTGEGPISNLFEAVGFLRSSAAKPSPDIQAIFMAIGYHKENGIFKLANYPSIMVHVVNSYPLSSGCIRLRSNNPSDPPLIECSLLQEQADADALVEGIELIRSAVVNGPIAKLIAEEVMPGAGFRSRSETHEFVRNNTGISCHPIGTCRMGIGTQAVVGPNLRVHGVENLWVADASVIPEELSANMNAVCIMIGSKLGKEFAGVQSRLS